MVAGIVDDVRKRWRMTIPVLLTMLTMQGASIAYRVLKTCSCNQDFRFVPLIILPWTYYAVRGATSLQGIWRRLAIGWLLALIIASCALVGMIFFEAP